MPNIAKFPLYCFRFEGLVLLYREDLEEHLGQLAPGILLEKASYQGNDLLLQKKYYRWPGEIGIRNIAKIIIEDFSLSGG